VIARGRFSGYARPGKPHCGEKALAPVILHVALRSTRKRVSLVKPPSDGGVFLRHNRATPRLTLPKLQSNSQPRASNRASRSLRQPVPQTSEIWPSVSGKTLPDLKTQNSMPGSWPHVRPRQERDADYSRGVRQLAENGLPGQGGSLSLQWWYKRQNRLFDLHPGNISSLLNKATRRSSRLLRRFAACGRPNCSG